MNSDQSKIPHFITLFSQQSPPAWSFLGLFFTSFLIGKCFDKQGRRKEVLHKLCKPNHRQRWLWALVQQTLLFWEWKSESPLPYRHWRFLPTFQSRYRRCLCYSYSQCSSAQQLHGVSQSTEQTLYPSRALLPEEREPLLSVSTVVWRRKWGCEAGIGQSKTSMPGLPNLGLGSFRYRWLWGEHNLESGRRCSMSSQTTRSEEGAGTQGIILSPGSIWKWNKKSHEKKVQTRPMEFLNSKFRVFAIHRTESTFCQYYISSAINQQMLFVNCVNTTYMLNKRPHAKCIVQRHSIFVSSPPQ